MPYSPPTSPRVALVAVQLPDADDQAFAASIAERVRLGRTLGVEMVATVTQRRRARAAGTVVVSGKLFELKALAGQVLRAETPEGEDDPKGEDEDEEKDEDEDEDEDEEKDEDEDEEKNEQGEETAPPA